MPPGDRYAPRVGAGRTYPPTGHSPDAVSPTRNDRRTTGPVATYLILQMQAGETKRQTDPPEGPSARCVTIAFRRIRRIDVTGSGFV